MVDLDYANLAVSLGIQGTIVGDEYRAKCPLHFDNNPSFSMNIETGLWMCHSFCGAGNFYHLVERVLNCNPEEAREWISSNGRKASLEIVSARLGGLLKASTEVVTTTKEEGWKYYYKSLSNDVMPDWFMNRGFAWNTVLHWNIVYDRLKDAVVLPVFWQGEMVGIIIRNTNPALPKYENSEFKKSEIVFGEYLTQKPFIILVEGVLDALWLWQLGYNAVSILGSSISQRQVEILREHRFGEVVLALDNDEAGRHGTQRAVQMLTSNGWLLPQVKVVVFPGNKGEELYKKDAQDCTEDEFRLLFNGRKDYLRW